VKLEHEYEVRRDGNLLAAGATTLVCVDSDGRPQPVPGLLQVPSADASKRSRWKLGTYTAPRFAKGTRAGCSVLPPVLAGGAMRRLN